MSNTLLTDKRKYELPNRQPSETYTLPEQPRPLSIEKPFTSPSFPSKTPSIPFSITDETDDENPANASLPDSTSKRSHSHSHSRSHSRSASHSFSESKIEKLYKDQEQHKKTHGKLVPSKYPPKINQDDECDEDDLTFDRILLSFARQESHSRDKRRFSRSHFLHTPKLPSITQQSHIVPLVPNITRKRRADTVHVADVESSMSTSYFDTLKKCNITIPTHRQKWQDSCNEDTESENELYAQITPSPQPPDHGDDDGDMASASVSVFSAQNEEVLPIKTQPKMRTGVSMDSFLEQSGTSSSSGVHLNGGNGGVIKLIGGSHSQTLTSRARSSTIRPRGSKVGITCTRGMEIELHDINGSDSDDEIVTDYTLSMDDDEKDIDPKQAELVFATTAQSLMVSCGDSREVFAILRTMCITLKKDESLPYIIDFSDKILKYDHVESFLKLLGFIKNKNSKQWTCYKERRVENRLIDCGVLECHKCLQEIQKHESIKDLVSQHRNNNKKRKDFSLCSPPLPPALSVVQQSKSFEQSLFFNSDDHDEIDDADFIQIHELIWSITHNNNDDHHAKDVLLLTYPLVTSAKNILLCCEARFFSDDYDGRITLSTTSTDSTLSQISFPPFDGHSPRSSTPSTTEFNKNLRFDRILSSFSVQAKVIEFIRHWMQRYWDKDWHDNHKLINYCKTFIRRIRKAYASDDNLEPIEIQKGNRIVEMLEKTMRNEKRKLKITLNKKFGDEPSFSHSLSLKKKHSLSRSQTPTLKGKKKRLHKKQPSRWSLKFSNSSQLLRPKELVDVNYITIAEQVTISQFKQYQKIHPRECLKQAWKDQEKKHLIAPNITQYINSFNRLTKWIQSSILVAENVRMRGKTIKKWVKVEEELYKLRNFQALCAVYAALVSTPIWKLKEAWSEVKKKHIVQHEMIKVIMKSTQNWKNLRRLELETHPPMLPYFGMFAQDLIIIEETTSNRANDGSINWDALWRVNAAIDKHLIYQYSAYNNLTENATVQRWMSKELYMSGKLDDLWVYQVANHVSKKDKNEALKGKKSARSLFKSK